MGLSHFGRRLRAPRARFFSSPVAWTTLAVAFGWSLHGESPSLAADHNDPIHVQANHKSGGVAGYEVNTGDPSADIADIFAWYTGTAGDPKSVVAAITWRVDPLETSEKSFDPSVAYGIHIGTGATKPLEVNFDNPLNPKIDSKFVTKAAHDIVVWFGKGTEANNNGQWGMRVSGLPGVATPLVGPVGKPLSAPNGVRVAAGLFDDAFFADLDGFFNAIYVALGTKDADDSARNPSLPRDTRYTLLDPKGNPNSPLLARPFGYPARPLDGFGNQNVHGIVAEIPVGLFGGQRKLQVWATTEREGPRQIGRGPPLLDHAGSGHGARQIFLHAVERGGR
ncbi:MAG: DUF4331 family protein [Polyangiaceae bacterium]